MKVIVHIDIVVLLALLSLIIAANCEQRFATREDYIGRFKKAVVNHCKDCLNNIKDPELKDFFLKELPQYENVSFNSKSKGRTIMVQMFEDEEMTKQGEMFFLDTMPYQFCVKTFQHRGFYPTEMKEDL